MERKAITRSVSGRRFSIDVPVTWDDDAGDHVIQATDLGAAELCVAAELATDGPIDGDTFRFMRTTLSFESRQLARLLGVRPETVSRWENAVTAVDRSAWFTLSSLVLERMGRQLTTLERLERLAEGAPAPHDVRLTV